MRKHAIFTYGVGFIAILLSLFIGLNGGKTILPWQLSEIDKVILFDLRLAKIITAITVGICLAIAGHLFQLLLANPLAEPSLLGISGIASLAVILGAAGLISSAFDFSVFYMFLFALCGAALAISVIFLIAKKLGNYASLAIILAGICITTITSAISSWFIFYSDNDQLRIFSVWMLGSFEHVTMTSALVTLAATGVIVSLLKRRSRALNFVYLGDRNAQLHGIDVKRLRLECLSVAALLTAIAVSLGGIVAFLGLLVPHACRMIFGNDNKHLITKLCFVGATAMVFIEFLSRSLMSTNLPLALVSATLGGPLFIWVLFKHFAHRNHM
ncbi:Hemin transport system permease protein HmuU [Pseudoalteromonas sp. P1-9]|uniref:FecCD family ABC transporter permease n=1 Tax=Pseudoalteromonas sp. P1-9 TaxID=1710354 RepID=UPI0006D6316A|nr:iron ABC transporter permease [Pseudoalteromonas sp. P1-9]KPV98392.1 Hemin transport system permease protein HmuU [Pseudoalteromonas sp. P1-9]